MYPVFSDGCGVFYCSMNSYNIARASMRTHMNLKKGS